MTFQHWAGVSSYTSACAFAETCVFDKQSLGPFHCDQPGGWHHFSRSYVVILPSSLTRVIPSVLGFSPRPPVSVCGTGTLQICLADFLGSMITCTIGLYRSTLRTIRFESHGGFACHDQLLHPLTDYSVSRRHCHSYVSTIAP